MTATAEARYEVRIWRATRRTSRLPGWAWYVRRCDPADPDITLWRVSGYTYTRRGAGWKALRRITARRGA